MYKRYYHHFQTRFDNNINMNNHSNNKFGLGNKEVEMKVDMGMEIEIQFEGRYGDEKTVFVLPFVISIFRIIKNFRKCTKSQSTKFKFN